MIDTILGFLYNILDWGLGILPNSPFQGFASDLKNGPFVNVINYINYFVPVGNMVSFFTLYLGAVSVWYIVRWVLRLARYIQ